jgi:FixJ family two-component response regulator
MPASATPATVVLVEDDEALLQALRFMFASEGYEALACGTGEALLHLTLPGGDVCLVIDERLPGVSGLEALAVLRGRGVMAPALLTTTNPDSALHAAAARTGAQVVEKPLVGDILLAAVKAALAARRRT